LTNQNDIPQKAKGIIQQREELKTELT